MAVRAIEAEMVVRASFGNVVLTPRHWTIVKEVELLCLDLGWTEVLRRMMNAQICWQDM